MSERLRLFVALDLPAEVRHALAAWAACVAPEGVRLLSVESLHLTLVFLGFRSQQEADAVASLLPRVSAPVAELCATGALWLPIRRPAVLAVALAGTSKLEALQASVAAALAGAIGYRAERRRFRPHVTVGRLLRGTRTRDTELPDGPVMTFTPEALTLYRSYTEPGGSRYEALASERLT